MNTNEENDMILSGIDKTNGSRKLQTPDITYFGPTDIKTVAKPLEVTQEELNAIIGGEIFYKAAAIVAMRHGLLKIKEAQA